MSEFQILMPKMGESVQEATLTKLFVKKGDMVEEDDVLFEIATDKVDSEIPSPVDGLVKEIRFKEDDLIPVGETVILIDLEGEDNGEEEPGEVEQPSSTETHVVSTDTSRDAADSLHSINKLSARFYSPLVKSIAQKEGISAEELNQIEGSGARGRVQKKDILNYIKSGDHQKEIPAPEVSAEVSAPLAPQKPKVSVSIGAEDTIVKMDRIRKIIAEHMVMSKQVSPHVTSVIEADVTEMVLWRNRIKNEFAEKYGEKITFMPLIMEAVAQALTEFKQVNASVDGDNIILRKSVNIGFAVATNDENLVVPVVNDANMKNLVGLTNNINQLAAKGRVNGLSPDDLTGGTFTITNFGTFGNIIGTPIINQPQVAILAVGTIEKKPAVVELPTGDAIVVRHKMFLSLSYDHRIVDGMLGGKFLRRIGDLLEAFNSNRAI